jgi:hypothetical protein
MATAASDVDFNLDSPAHLIGGIRSFFSRLAPILFVSFVECEPDKLESPSSVAQLKLILSTFELLLRHTKASFSGALHESRI